MKEIECNPPAAPDGGETLEQIAENAWQCARTRSDGSQHTIFVETMVAVLRDHSRQQEERIKELERKQWPAVYCVGCRKMSNSVACGTCLEDVVERAESAERERDALLNIT